MTGYTGNLIEKKQTFPEFALSCARAFGALVTMRDEPMGAEIPAVLEASSYHAKALADARERISKLSAMSPAQALAYGANLKAESIKSLIGYKEKQDADNQALRDMIAQVEAWQPPTADHIGLKSFMLQQLNSSLFRDYYGPEIAEKTIADPITFYDAERARAIRDAAYHLNSDEEDRARVASRQKWIDDLRGSL